MLTAPCRECTTYISISLSNTSVSHSKLTPGDDKRDKAKTLVHKYLAFHKRAHILNCTICGSQRRRLFLVHTPTKMSYQKPEKDFGEGPVSFYHSCLL